MTATIGSDNSSEMQSECSLHRLNTLEKSLFTIIIHWAV